MPKKYKCPYCEKRMIRKDLINHIDKKHEELIPQNYTASRVIYNTINKVDHGKCRVCGKSTTWSEHSGRYNVLCGDPKCKEHMREEYKKNMLRVRGTYNILNDPEQQKKMLANRSISGAYKFTDGGILTYTGSYERKCLEFMDVVMQIPSKDIIAPGPTLYYKYNGKEHFYITDFYYPNYNLIIEVKDGGDNPNKKNTLGMQSSREKTIEKEHLITDRGEYNYVRLTNNNFSQLIEVFMNIKQKLIEGIDTPTININESEQILSYVQCMNEYDTGVFNTNISTINEASIYEGKTLMPRVPSNYLTKNGYHVTIYKKSAIKESKVLNEEDIYYNKDKFDSGEINLCFITGHSGSGKSTMAHGMEGDKIEVYELDDVIANYNFSDSNLKEYGDLIYSFFKGPGKRFRYTSKKEWDNDEQWDNKNVYIDGYEVLTIKEFVKYAIAYVKSHNNIKFIIEGIWLYEFIEPKDIDKYAVYIKGTSMLISKIRAAKRDSKNNNGMFKPFVKQLIGDWKFYFLGEEKIKKYRDYFIYKMNKD